MKFATIHILLKDEQDFDNDSEVCDYLSEMFANSEGVVDWAYVVTDSPITWRELEVDKSFIKEADRQLFHKANRSLNLIQIYDSYGEEAMLLSTDAPENTDFDLLFENACFIFDQMQEGDYLGHLQPEDYYEEVEVFLQLVEELGFYAERVFIN